MFKASIQLVNIKININLKSHFKFQDNKSIENL